MWETGRYGLMLPFLCNKCYITGVMYGAGVILVPFSVVTGVI